MDSRRKTRAMAQQRARWAKTQITGYHNTMLYVDQFYDRKTRNWTTLYLDKHGDQHGDAQHDGDKAGAKATLEHMTRENETRGKEETLWLQN